MTLLYSTWSGVLCSHTGTKFYSPICDAEFLIANDTSYNGHDLQSSHNIPGTVQYSSTQDPTTCCAYCFATTNCTAWTVSDEAGYGYCYFCYPLHKIYSESNLSDRSCSETSIGTWILHYQACLSLDS